MTLSTLLVVIVLAGLALWAIDRWVPMAAGPRRVLHVVVVVALVVLALQVFGVLGALQRRVRL